MTVRQKLVIYATGRVTGKIRYGKVIIEEGGQLMGDIQFGATKVISPIGSPMAAPYRPSRLPRLAVALLAGQCCSRKRPWCKRHIVCYIGKAAQCLCAVPSACVPAERVYKP